MNFRRYLNIVPSKIAWKKIYKIKICFQFIKITFNIIIMIFYKINKKIKFLSKTMKIFKANNKNNNSIIFCNLNYNKKVRN